MSEEAAFLAALKANPADDTARLVYADWLDEHDEPAKAEYVRLVAKLVQTCDGCSRDQPDVAHLLSVSESLPLEWRQPVGSRFMVAVYHSEPAQQIKTIMHIRRVSGVGLLEAKTLSEQTPSKILVCVPFEQALAARDYLLTVPGTVVRIHPSEAGSLPLSVGYQVVVTCSVWKSGDAWATAVRAAMRAFTEFLCNALGVTPEAAAEFAATERYLVADGLELREAQTRAAELRPLLPRTLSDGWSISVDFTPTNLRPNSPW